MHCDISSIQHLRASQLSISLDEQTYRPHHNKSTSFILTSFSYTKNKSMVQPGDQPASIFSLISYSLIIHYNCISDMHGLVLVNP